MRLRWIVPCFFVLLPATGSALPILNEVYYDAVGSDATEVFTEILGAPAMSLDGWSLVGINGATGSAYQTLDLAGAVIPEDGLLVIATAAATGKLLSVRDFIGSVDWQNGPDAVALRNPLGVVVDALQYGDAGAGNAGEGLPAPDAPPGLALARDGRGTDTNDNARDFAVASPTPGRRASVVSEPTTVGMLLAGFASLFSGFRRTTA